MDDVLMSGLAKHFFFVNTCTGNLIASLTNAWTWMSCCYAAGTLAAAGRGLYLIYYYIIIVIIGDWIDRLDSWSRACFELCSWGAAAVVGWYERPVSCDIFTGMHCCVFSLFSPHCKISLKGWNSTHYSFSGAYITQNGWFSSFNIPASERWNNLDPWWNPLTKTRGQVHVVPLNEEDHLTKMTVCVVTALFIKRSSWCMMLQQVYSLLHFLSWQFVIVGCWISSYIVEQQFEAFVLFCVNE